jgi:acetylornithine deacetylase/succinyl-diaminopimelate desuccinylase-like protein
VARHMKRPTHRSRRPSAAIETDVLRFLAANEAELVEFARELIATPSPNPPGDERQVVALARDRMASLGYVNFVTAAMEPTRPNLVGDIAGSANRPVLMLNGHIDTKPAGDLSEWTADPNDPVIRDGRIYGLGAADMKGAVAAMVYAGAAIGQLDTPGGTVRVCLTADEESGSRLGARFVAGRSGFSSDAVLVGEPTGMESSWAYIAVASRGLSCFRVRVRGTQMHSSLSDQVPSVNASVKLAEVLVRMAREFMPSQRINQAVSGRATVNLGVTLTGGVYFGVYPGHAEFGIDVRTLPGMTLTALEGDIVAFLEKLRREDNQLDATVEAVPGLEWLPPSAIDPRHPLVGALRSAAGDVLGRDVPNGTMPAFTDGTYWGMAGIPCVPAFGPGSLLVAHRPNESVAVEDIVMASRIYALGALRFLGSYS